MAAPDPRKPHQPHKMHGLYALRRRLKLRGLRGIDKRYGAGRALMLWQLELVADLGGSEALSAQQRAVIEVASATKLLHDSVTRWMLEQPKLVNAKRRAVYPVVLQRQQLADSLARQMAMLGLERRQRTAPSLEEYVRERYGQNGSQRLEDGSRNDRDHDPRTDGGGAAAPEPHV